MLVATFGPTTGWAGKAISYENGQFTLEDSASSPPKPYSGMTARAIWPGPTRSCASGCRGSPDKVPRLPRPRRWQEFSLERGKGLPGWVIALIILGVVAVIAAVVLAVAIPAAMVSDQDSKAKESGVKEGMHSIQIGIQSWAVDHGDLYPEAAEVDQFGAVGGYVDLWPTNPYSGLPMAQGTGPGEYTYTSDGKLFQLTGYGEDGQAVMTIP